MRDKPMKRHARAGNTGVTWCGQALDDVLWSEDGLVTCERCLSIREGDSAAKKDHAGQGVRKSA